MSEHEERPDLRTRFINFFSHYRLPLIIAGVVIVVGLMAFLVGSEIVNTRLQQSLVLAEEAQTQFQEWRNLDPESEEAIAAAQELETALDEILSRFPRRYAAARALFIRGSLRFEREEFGPAAESYESVATRFPESHLAPVAMSNAAASYEEADDEENASRMWQLIADTFGRNSAETPRALFALGRLAEDDGSFAIAAIQYNRLLDDYPSSSWTSLARNRIIYLTTEGLIGG